mmetsp:Transcript_72249/g.193240  ORF Transcript_72249/g.193240 Transcript_72249/m.193240 type:complete len:224 (+) Transcript_72249:179-850(+)
MTLQPILPFCSTLLSPKTTSESRNYCFPTVILASEIQAGRPCCMLQFGLTILQYLILFFHFIQISTTKSFLQLVDNRPCTLHAYRAISPWSNAFYDSTPTSRAATHPPALRCTSPRGTVTWKSARLYWMLRGTTARPAASSSAATGTRTWSTARASRRTTGPRSSATPPLQSGCPRVSTTLWRSSTSRSSRIRCGPGRRSPRRRRPRARRARRAARRSEGKKK